MIIAIFALLGIAAVAYVLLWIALAGAVVGLFSAIFYLIWRIKWKAK